MLHVVPMTGIATVLLGGTYIVVVAKSRQLQSSVKCTGRESNDWTPDDAIKLLKTAMVLIFHTLEMNICRLL